MSSLPPGFPEPTTVATQSEPDPDFPTVSFPNPEEAGAIDAALAVAREVRPDVVIANDPDADRCAAAVLDADGWRMLRGDELGALLGAHVIDRGVDRDAVFACSIVSSRLLAAMAAANGIRHEETLTGFKWISRVPGLAFGYEEALGYCVAPQIARDKDGVSAALLLAELVASLRARGQTVLDVLDTIAVDTASTRPTRSPSGRRPHRDRPRDGTAAIQPAPRARAGPVSRVDDLARGDGGLPPTDGVRWFLADDSRVIVRPSGTEPKIKVYLEAVEPVAEPGSSRGPSGRGRTTGGMRTAMESLTRI